MNRPPSVCIGIFLASLVACEGPRRDQAEGTRFDVDQAIGAWLEAWNQRDLSLVDGLFLDDDKTSYFSSEREGLIRGFPAIREHHAGFGFVAGGTATADELWVADVHASVHGTSAVVAATWFFGNRDGPAEDIQRGPMTAVYVFDGSDYRIAHMHFSTYLITSDPTAPAGGGST